MESTFKVDNMPSHVGHDAEYSVEMNLEERPFTEVVDFAAVCCFIFNFPFYCFSF